MPKLKNTNKKAFYTILVLLRNYSNVSNWIKKPRGEHALKYLLSTIT